MESTEALMDDLERKYAFSIAITDDQGRVLSAKRNANRVKDYKGWWSIPSMNVSQLEYDYALKNGVLPESALQKFSNRILPGLHLQNIELAISTLETKYPEVLDIS